MDYLLLIAALLIAVMVVCGYLLATGRAGGSGRSPADPRPGPHAEKEQLTGPQEEFVSDTPAQAAPPPRPAR